MVLGGSCLGDLGICGGSNKYTEWDYESKKCPKCKDGIIGESDKGIVIMVD